MVRSQTATDGSSQLPDRALVVDRLTEALTTAEHATAVLLVDLDDFRMVNASRGHGVGDRLLDAVGARLRAGVSDQETVGRLGDDEFVVVCQDTDEHSAHALACFLRNTLAEPFCVDGAAVNVTASIGVAAAPAGATVTAVDLLRQTDAAVHAGKSAGRGRVHVYDPTLGDGEADRYALGADLPAALVRGALTVEYQPVMDLRTGTLVGLEALARWTHPQRGPVPPSAFVRVAEVTGVAPDLDRWVIQRALRDMASLRAAGAVPAEAYLAVNLSAANLTDSHLFDRLLDWTADAGVPAKQLVLEITETAIMQDPHLAARLLRRLREQGIRVAMDDFGTGYSSLANLRDLPVSALKVDRSFVADITEERDALAIVGWIIDLARALEVDVVAEGVETAAQADLLQELGCVTGQGWLWGPAVPLTDLSSRRGWPLRTGRDAAGRAGTTQLRQRSTVDAHGVERLLELRRDGASIDAIAAALDAEGFRTPADRLWRPASVARLISQRIRRHFHRPGNSPNARRSAWPPGTASATHRRGTRSDVRPPEPTGPAG